MACEYTIQDVVRDYECDVQGVVNNAEYMHYCEHARNQSIQALGYSLVQCNQQGQDPVVARAELVYKKPLHGGDAYTVNTKVYVSGSYKLIFEQRITSMQEQQEVENMTGKFTIAVLHEGRPLAIDKSIFVGFF